MTITLEVSRPRYRDGKRRADRDRSSSGPAGHAAGTAARAPGPIFGDAFRPAAERGAA